MMSIEINAVGHVQGTGPVYAVTQEYCVEATPKWGLYTTEFLRTDGAWTKDREEAATFNTREEATAFAMGCGVIPFDFLIEETLLEDADKKLDLACKCFDLKVNPIIDRLIREGKREEAIDFAVSAPHSYVGAEKIVAIYRRAKYHKPEAA